MRIWGRMCTAVLATLLSSALPLAAHAAHTQSELRLSITPQLKVSVTDQWSGLQQANGKFEYFSAAREHGTIPVDVHDGGFKVSFETGSYLRQEDGLYYLVTPDFYYPAGPLDVRCTLEYPATLKFVDAKPAPDKTGAGRLEWDLRDCSHRFILARFEPAAGAPLVPAPTPSSPPPALSMVQPDGSQVQPSELPKLTSGELPHSPDEVLTEMRNVLRVAQLDQSTDPQFIRVMNKLLAKFYYLFAQEGALPPRESKPAAPAAASTKAPQPTAPRSAGGAGKASDPPRFRGIW